MKLFYNPKFILGIALIIGFLFSFNVYAAGYPWLNHNPPFSFYFGNSFDAHQQTELNNNGTLVGFLYISFTGETIDGLPVAIHGDETVGWAVDGVPVTAILYDNTTGEHPIWCIDSQDVPKSQGFAHFHWVGPDERADLIEGQIYEGYLLKLTAVDSFYFVHAGDLVITPGIDNYSHDNIVTNCQ